MKKIILTLVILAGFAVQALAYDFQSGNLLYTIISADPPCVSLSGHVDGQAAQGGLVIPETVENDGVIYTVTEIGRKAFYRCSNLTGELVIPNTITYIFIEAFTDCTGLTGSLVIPDNIVEIGTEILPTTFYGAFEGCTGFTNLVLGGSVQKIGCKCFYGCSGFTGPLILPQGIQEIGVCAFVGCSGFNGELVLPSSLKRIHEGAFEDCTGFTGTLIIPETIDRIGYGAFRRDKGIENIILPSRYVFAGDSLDNNRGYHVFSGCTGLTSVEIPEGWENTSDGTFEKCTNLRSVRLPQSLKRIGSDCFDSCTSLSEINVPEGVTQIGAKAFFNCERLAEFVFPDSLTVIGAGAFSHCTSLTGNLSIPDLVEEIMFYTFNSCIGYNSLVIGKSVNWIVEQAFENTQLEKIIIKATTPPELKRFTNAWHFPADIPITVPCGTLEAYRNAEGWSEFTNMHEGPALLLSVVSENEGYGSVRVLKEATCEDVSVEVEALPNEGCAFLYWEANGVEVATDNPYSFVLEEDTELVARFSGAGLDEMDPSVCFYPNPTTGMVTVRGENLSQAVVTDLLGQQVLGVQGEGDELQIDMTALPAGVYFVTVTDENGRKCVRKAVRE